jgi:hypothetical protein
MAKVKFALTPYPLQQEVISYLDGIVKNAQDEPYRFFVLVIGRQAGKSWLAKYTLLDRAINRNQRCLWVAPSIPTARSHWDNLVKLVELSGMPVRKISQSAKQIIFTDGGEISVRSALEPDNMRGLTIDYIVMDEAAFYRNGEYVWYSVILPMVTASHGVVLFTTTPNGRNYLYKLFKYGQNKANLLYKSWQAPSKVSPYQDTRLLAEIAQSMPSVQYREEFGAEFLTDGGGVFSGGEAAAIVTPLAAPLSNHSYVAGLDFGFNHDATTFTVIDEYSREQVYGTRFFSVGTHSTIKTFKKLIRRWRPRVTYLEKNGIGEALFDILRKALTDDEFDDLELLDVDVIGASAQADDDDEDVPIDRTFTDSVSGAVVKAIHMDNRMKRKMVEGLSADIEYSRLKLLAPTEDSYGEIQLNEMSTYQRQRTASGLEITYNADEGAYDDTVSALYLARYGLPRKKPIMDELQKRVQQRNKKPSPLSNRGRNTRMKGRR